MRSSLLDHCSENQDDSPVRFLPVLSAAFLLVSGCTSLSQGPGSAWSSSAQQREVVQKVLATGRGLIGQKPEARVTVNGRKFTLDCVGTVSAAWWGAGIDLRQDFARYPGDAVNRLYRSLQSWGALHRQRTPAPGDLIIWDHTWDTAGDPNYPEGHTHAGLVLSVGPDGRIEYLHESATRGVVTAYMNLYDPEGTLTPEGRVINSPMYLGANYGRASNPPRWTSAHLWSAFGDASVVVRTLEGS